MTKIALVENLIVHHVWSIGSGETELAIRHDLPDGAQVSPVALGWSEGDFAVLPVTEFDLPAGKQVSGPAEYSVVDGEVIEAFPVEDIAVALPDRVTARQFKLQLLALGLYDDVTAWVAMQDQAVQIAWEYSGTFLRSEPMMLAGFAAMGFSETQIDDFYIAASAL